MSQLSLRWVNDFEEWNKFNSESSQGSIFSNTHFLKATNQEFKIRGIYKGEELKCGMIYCISDGNIVANDLIIYNGPIMQTLNGKKGGQNQKEFAWIELLANDLEQNYNEIFFNTSPRLVDIRPFQWVNYHNSGRKFTVNTRYTAEVDVTELKQEVDFEQTDFFKNLETLRQRNYRAAIKENLIIVPTFELDNFIEDYDFLMMAQGSKQSEKKLENLNSLLSYLLEYQLAVQYNVYINNLVSYRLIMALDGQKAYYLFGAPSRLNPMNLSGTFGFLKSFSHLARNYNISKIDLEGANSPKRGAYKMSLGAQLVPYYNIRLE